MTLAGLPGLRGGEDGKGIAARFDEPHGICYDDTTKSVIVCEPRSNRLRRVQLNGMTSNLPLPPGLYHINYHANEYQVMCPLCAKSKNLWES